MSDLVDLTALQCYYETLEMLQSLLLLPPREGGTTAGKSAASSPPLPPLVTAAAVMAWHGFYISIGERLEEVASIERICNTENSDENTTTTTTAVLAGGPLGDGALRRVPHHHHQLLPITVSPGQKDALASLVAIRDKWTSALAHLMVLPPIAAAASAYAEAAAGSQLPLPPLRSRTEMALAMVVATLSSAASSTSESSSAAVPFAAHCPLPARLFAMSVMLGSPTATECLKPFTFLKEAMAAREVSLLMAADDSAVDGGSPTSAVAAAGGGLRSCILPLSAGATTAAGASGPTDSHLASFPTALQPFGAASPSPLRSAAISLFKACAESRLLSNTETFKVPPSVFDSLKVGGYIAAALGLIDVKGCRHRDASNAAAAAAGVGVGDDDARGAADDGDTDDDTSSVDSDETVMGDVGRPYEPVPSGQVLPEVLLAKASSSPPPALGCGPLQPILKALYAHRSGGFVAGECASPPLLSSASSSSSSSSNRLVRVRLPPFLSADGRKITASFGTSLLQGDHYVVVQSSKNGGGGEREAGGGGGAVQQNDIATFSSQPEDRRWLESSYSQLVSHLATFAYHVGERYSPPATHGMLPVVNDLLRCCSLLGLDSTMVLFTASVENYGSADAARARLQVLHMRSIQLGAKATAAATAMLAAQRQQQGLSGGGPLAPSSPSSISAPSLAPFGSVEGDLVQLRDSFLSYDDGEEASATITSMCEELSPTDPTSTHLTLRHHPVRDLSLRLMLYVSVAYKRLLAEVRLAVAKAVVSVYDDEEVMDDVFKQMEERSKKAAKVLSKRRAEAKKERKAAKKDKKSSSSGGKSSAGAGAGAGDEEGDGLTDPVFIEATPFVLGLLANLIHPLICTTAALPDIAFSPSSLSAAVPPSDGPALLPPTTLPPSAPNAGTHVIRYAVYEILTTIDGQLYEKFQRKHGLSSIGASKWEGLLKADRRALLKYIAVTPLLDGVGDPLLRSQLLSM